VRSAARNTRPFVSIFLTGGGAAGSGAEAFRYNRTSRSWSHPRLLTVGDTTTPAGKAMFQMLGVFAEFERSIVRERVRAGLLRARREGKRLGRPRILADLEKRILAALKAPGRTEGVRKIAARGHQAATRAIRTLSRGPLGMCIA
jgi:DNA invertase Pin-like site-specific DNA recombinase